MVSGEFGHKFLERLALVVGRVEDLDAEAEGRGGSDAGDDDVEVCRAGEEISESTLRDEAVDEANGTNRRWGERWRA